MSIADKLLQHFPDADWAMSGETYATLEWFGPGDKPTEAEIDALVLGPFVPSEVTIRQAKLALFNAGLLAQVDTALTNMTGDDGERARIEWNNTSTVTRDSLLVASLAAALGLTDQQVDSLFIAAAAL